MEWQSERERERDPWDLYALEGFKNPRLERAKQNEIKGFWIERSEVGW